MCRTALSPYFRGALLTSSCTLGPTTTRPFFCNEMVASAYAVIMEGIEDGVSESDIANFLSYCGEVASVTFTGVTQLGRTARALFVAADSVGIAELLTGAVIGASPVTIFAEILSSEHDPTTSSEDVVQKMADDGHLRGTVLPAIRARAAAVDERLGIRSKLRVGVKAVGSVAAGAVSLVAAVVHGHQAQPTVQQWNSAPNQPQWGAPPANRPGCFF